VLSFDLVSKGSTYFLNAFAFATVVVMRLFKISDDAMLDNNA
jgi:hypothetical protein